VATSIVMPKMGYDMTEGRIARWLKREGETVRAGEAIAEIETDKVTIEMEAAASGVLSRIIVLEGEVTPVGQLIAVLSAPGEVITVGQPSDGHGHGTEPASDPLDSPVAAGLSAQESTVPAPSHPTSPPVARPPAAPSSAAGASPLARRLAREQGVDLSTVRGAGPGGRITREDVLAAAAAAAATVGASAMDTTDAPNRVARPMHDEPAAPGRDGKPASARSALTRVVRDESAAPGQDGLPPRSATDMDQDARERITGDGPAAAPGETESTPGATQPADRMLTRLQQTMGRRMSKSKKDAPHFYLTREADLTAALALRAEINAEGGDEGKVSVNDLVVKAAAMALTRFPTLNASFAGDRLALHDEVAIAIAVALDDGLVTPVLHHADRKSIAHIARETRALAARARGGASRAADYEGGTFTVSNLGMFAVDTFVAIINPPQAAILAIGAVRRVPVYVGDALVPRERVSLTLSVDHRVADGAVGARFLAAVCDALEHPVRLLLS